jgi:hypothetical protein
MEEKRKSQRYPLIIDVTIACNFSIYRAEVFDINLNGVGISWIQGNRFVPNDTPAQIRCDHPAFGGQSLLGLIKGCPPRLTYQPNVRSVGLEIDQACSDLVERVIKSCVRGCVAPKNESPGLQRAWNTLESQERTYMSEYFEKLAKSENVDELQVFGNLMTDSNASGHRWRNFMKILLKQVMDDKDKSVAPFDTLTKAFASYKGQFSLHDTERDKPIHGFGTVNLTGSMASGSK